MFLNKCDIIMCVKGELSSHCLTVLHYYEAIYMCVWFILMISYACVWLEGISFSYSVEAKNARLGCGFGKLFI